MRPLGQYNFGQEIRTNYCGRSVLSCPTSFNQAAPVDHDQSVTNSDALAVERLVITRRQ